MTVVLGIETSCDETAVGIVKDGKTILTNLLASHVDAHKSFGGVFPEISSRRHFDLLLPLVKEALDEASLTFSNIDVIAVANRPGLMGSLLMGVNCAKSLAYALNIPIVSVNHIEAHLYAAMMSENDFTVPSLGLIASGGHTTLVNIMGINEYEVIGQSVDDSVGEAFDKVGRLLDIPYPAGPKMEELARGGDCRRFDFGDTRLKTDPFSFSYSGLKTKALYLLKGQNRSSKDETILPQDQFSDFAASFQEHALTPLVLAAKNACLEFGISKVYIGGGVSCNQRFREIFDNLMPKHVLVVWPKKGLCLDNGAMIAGLGYQNFLKSGQKGENLSLTAFPSGKCLSL